MEKFEACFCYFFSLTLWCGYFILLSKNSQIRGTWKDFISVPFALHECSSSNFPRNVIEEMTRKTDVKIALLWAHWQNSPYNERAS